MFLFYACLNVKCRRDTISRTAFDTVPAFGLIRLIGVAIIALLMAFLPLRFAAAEGLQLYEQEIKAGLLYNFLKYTDWPPASMNGTSVTVCVFDDDPFAEYLQPMAGRIVNRRQIAIRIIHKIENAITCHLLFINANEKSRWPQLVESLKGKPVLTVSDFDGFADSGGMIEFGKKGDHISANLNIEAVTAARLHVQDRLLRLVTVMHSGGNP